MSASAEGLGGGPPPARYRRRGRCPAAAALLLALAGLGCAAGAPHTTTTRSHTSVVATKRTYSQRRSREPGKGWRQGRKLPEREYIYVYDVPPEFTADIEKKPVQWHPEQYDFDQVVHKWLLGSPLRTRDPEKAQLFFVPAYLGRHYNWFWQQYSAEGDAWSIVRDCKPQHSAQECWWEKWTWAKQVTSKLVGKALDHVKEQPYWDRLDGADHFMVFSYDHARCDMALDLSSEELGELFSVQSFGDLTLTNKPDVPPLIQRNGESYEWGGPRAWACYRPDADILLPMFYPAAAEDVVSPLQHKRGNPVVMRFGYKVGDGKNLVEHYGHRLRKELLDMWEAAPYSLERPQFAGPVSEAQTDAEMAETVFCVCPPGATQDTTRFWRAMLKGCLPVTFFRANDLPFARNLKIPYEDFVLNLQPDDYHKLYPTLTAMLNNAGRMRFMQEALERYQRNFVWDPSTSESGVFGNLARELALKAARLDLGEPHFVQ